MAGAVESRFGKRAEIPWSNQGASASPRVASTGKHPSAIRRAVLPRAAGDRLGGLDLLRLLAALAVVLYHFGYAGPTRGFMVSAYPEMAGVAKYGFLGVDLFFLISGFVITASAYGRTWHEFAISRFLRLYPAHVVCMSLTALVLLSCGSIGAPVTFQQWLANLSMVSLVFGQPFMDGAYWSIVIEIVFYGWVGVMVAAGIFEKRLFTILTVWLAMAYLNELMFQSRALRFGLATEYAALFASGILIQRLRAGENNPYAWALLGFAFGLGGLHSFEVQRMFARFYVDGINLPLLWLAHVGVYAVFIGGLWLSRWMPSSRTVLTIGGLTYPLYLVHQQAGYALIDTLAPLVGRWEALTVAVGLSMAVAWAVSRWVEPTGRRVLRAAIDGLTAGIAAALPGLRLRPALASSPQR